jgi:hypothetical protein
MADWQPAQLARPTEWVMADNARAIPFAVIRRLEFDAGYSHDPEVWWRAVTWAESSEHRELIGYARTFQAAARAAWEHRLARDRDRHAAAAVRAHERSDQSRTAR